MDERQENITKMQRSTLVDKAYEYETITLQIVQNLKSFSAGLNNDSWNSLTSDNVHTVITYSNHCIVF